MQELKTTAKEIFALFGVVIYGVDRVRKVVD